ncbi:MAG: GTP cyclohydrolase II [Rhodospirillales bacterium]|nr:GTP cyclohydrolase II [Rhodospirillales bacterium]
MNTRRHLISVPATRQPLSVRAVERAVSELRRGRPVVLTGAEGAAILAQAAEATTAESLLALTETTGGIPEVAITSRRASVLGLSQTSLRGVGVSFKCASGLDQGKASKLTAELVCAFADPLSDRPLPIPTQLNVRELPAHSCEQAGLLLAKTSRLLPAAVCAPINDPSANDVASWAGRHSYLLVDAGDIYQYDHTQARMLRPVGEARVPLLGADNARVIAFRPFDGGLEHLAVILGEPPPEQAVLTRLHSECFTGDLLGSLRCDCGDQLRGAIREITQAGGGVLLYLAQEGRGIGLVNKLRAYTLQDRGFDTLDANGQLGFDEDERVYLPAAQMLRMLGFPRVRLLTNNPAKVQALNRLGVAVEERVPHAFPTNRHNEVYLRTKAVKGGHLL